jgi:hypothetical protein
MEHMSEEMFQDLHDTRLAHLQVAPPRFTLTVVVHTCFTVTVVLLSTCIAVTVVVS